MYRHKSIMFFPILRIDKVNQNQKYKNKKQWVIIRDATVLSKRRYETGTQRRRMISAANLKSKDFALVK